MTNKGKNICTHAHIFEHSHMHNCPSKVNVSRKIIEIVILRNYKIIFFIKTIHHLLRRYFS